MICHDISTRSNQPVRKEWVNLTNSMASTFSHPGLGFLCGIPSMVFFVNKEKNSTISPAESRDLNADCSLLNFYDGLGELYCTVLYCIVLYCILLSVKIISLQFTVLYCTVLHVLY